MVKKKNNQKLGLAVYLNENSNVNKIFKMVKNKPDFIHLDLVDETILKNKTKPKIENIFDFYINWKNKLTQLHIMSLNPKKYIGKHLLKYKNLKTIFFHDNFNNKTILEIKNYILDLNLIPGIVIQKDIINQKLEFITNNFNEILVLCIDKPGFSGQKFQLKSKSLINKINNHKNRKKINLTVDGGINENNIKDIYSDYYVSSSFIMTSKNPYLQILKLKKIINNEKY